MNEIALAINSANQKFMDALRLGDPERVAALYTLDATLLPPGSKMVSGREAIRGFWNAAINMGVKDAKLKTVKLDSKQDSAHEIGQFQLTIRQPDGQNAAPTGKYVVIWKRQNETWHLDVDIWNFDA